MNRLDLTTLLIVSTGAFVYWTLSGYKGKFNDHMSRYYDSDTKYDKNYITGLGVLVVLAIIIFAMVGK